MTFDGSTQLAQETTEPEARALCGRGYYWTTVEHALLREHYPKAGARALAGLLPHRTLSSIHAQAQKLGLRAPPGLSKGLRFPRTHRASPHLDADIRALYATMTHRGAVKSFSEAKGLPAWWVQKRASILGLTRSVRSRIDGWTAKELSLLEDYAACDLPLIAKKLRDAGFTRTPTAIAIQLKRRGMDRTDPDTWTAPDLAGLLGVNAATVADWIERRGLKAEKKPWGHTGRWVIKRRALKAWLAENPRFIDLRKVDQPWFMDLAFGSAA